MGESVTELTSSEFESFIKEGIVLVDFYADWCMPCVMMSPVIDELANKFSGKIKFGKINVEDAQEIAHRYRISSIPAFILIKNGQVLDRFTGALSVEDFEEKLTEHI